MLQHYLNLLHWGLLPELDPSPSGIYPTAPLTPLEFITHVLVPETAILLIMNDRGWTGEHDDATEEWGKARQEAYDIWTKSGEYGRARFVADDAEAKETLNAIQDRGTETRKACRKRRKGKIVRKPIDLPRSASPAKRSTSRVATPSETIETEQDSAQSIVNKAQRRDFSAAPGDLTPKGDRRSPIRIDLSPVASMAHNDLSQMPQAFEKSDSAQVPHAPPFLRVGKKFDRVTSNETVSSYAMEDDWMATDEAQVVAEEAERDRFGHHVVH